MPSDKAVIFLLAAVAMEETKKTYARRIYQFKNWKERRNGHLVGWLFQPTFLYL